MDYDIVSDNEKSDSQSDNGEDPKDKTQEAKDNSDGQNNSDSDTEYENANAGEAASAYSMGQRKSLQGNKGKAPDRYGRLAFMTAEAACGNTDDGEPRSAIAIDAAKGNHQPKWIASVADEIIYLVDTDVFDVV